MDRNYGGVIWTNHAIERLQQRGVKQGDAFAVFNRPQSSKFDPKRGAWVYRRVWEDQEIEVVAKKNDRGKWLILSAWSNTRNYSSRNVKKENSGIWGFVKKIFRG